MAAFSNPKRVLGTSLMALGFLALLIREFYPTLRHWFFFAYVLTFVPGLILNTMGWKEEKKAQQSG